MEFALSEDQRMLQDSMRGYLSGASGLDEIRKVAEGDAATITAISSGFAEMGGPLLYVPEAHGGLGLGILDAALVQETLGFAAAPARFFADVLAAEAIRSAGTEAQQSDWLPKIADGSATFAVALSQHVGARPGTGVEFAAGKLNGTSHFVCETSGSSHAIVVSSDGQLHICAMEAMDAKPMRTIDRTRTFHELTFTNTDAETLTGENTPGTAADRVVQAGRILLAADTLGACQKMLDDAVAYAKERKQFNRVIGSFQAVKHLCAEMAAELEPARALVWHAAYAMDTGDAEAPVMACLANSHLAEVGTFIARTSTEVHGGMGMTDLLGLHFWFKRIGVNRQLLGSPEKVREDAAKLQGWA